MYNLRFYQDTFPPDAACADLYAQHSILYVYRGSALISGRGLQADQALYATDAIPVTAGGDGAVVWRWELEREEAKPDIACGEGVVSRLRMVRKIKMFEMYPTTRWLFKLDCICNNIGTTGLHSHPGSGIRCLLSGNLNTASEKGEDTRNYDPGDCWYEEGAYPLVSTTDEGSMANFLRGMILPPEYAKYPDTAIWIEGKQCSSDWKGYLSQIIHLR